MLRFASVLKFLLAGLWLGIAAHSALGGEFRSGVIGTHLNRDQNSEFLKIDYVAAHSPAALAGLKTGDLVTAINGATTRGISADAGMELLDGKIGEKVTLDIRRAGSADQTISITKQSLIDVYSQAAAEGDIYAEYQLGVFHYYADKDYAKALEWFLKSAEGGFVPAQTTAASMYLSGYGTPKAPQEAVKWLDKAAAQGDAEAEEKLAGMYWRGDGVSTDDHLAFYWYDRLAQQNNPRAEWQLGYMYFNGIGVEKNIATALQWYQKAEAGLPDNARLKKEAAIATYRAFFRSREVDSFNTTILPSDFRQRMRLEFEVLVLIYLAGGITLFFFTLRPSNAPPRIPVAIGWAVFYIVGGATLTRGMLIPVIIITAPLVFALMCIFCMLPVIASSLGANRNLIWKTAVISRKKTLLFTGLAFVINGGFPHLYHGLYDFFTHQHLEPMKVSFLMAKSKHASPLLTYMVCAVFGPVCEEIIFRGYLFDSLRKRLTGRLTVVITAALFAAMHLQLSHFIPLFVCGLAFGGVKLKTDSVRPTMFLHMVNNAIAAALMR